MYFAQKVVAQARLISEQEINELREYGFSDEEKLDRNYCKQCKNILFGNSSPRSGVGDVGLLRSFKYFSGPVFSTPWHTALVQPPQMQTDTAQVSDVCNTIIPCPNP
jgi:hypothetical protein